MSLVYQAIFLDYPQVGLVRNSQSQKDFCAWNLCIKQHFLTILLKSIQEELIGMINRCVMKIYDCLCFYKNQLKLPLFLMTIHWKAIMTGKISEETILIDIPMVENPSLVLLLCKFHNPKIVMSNIIMYCNHFCFNQLDISHKLCSRSKETPTTNDQEGQTGFLPY